RTWFLILAFVSIGLEFRARDLRAAGWRPGGVFAAATAVNLLVALGLAAVLFSGFQAG
ncbi:MAG: putative sulfate exporter family transporter, partial [Saccharothrix sp.]|nr:putative sulfate exporter family transporter [Saccharothrix sp.]